MAQNGFKITFTPHEEPPGIFYLRIVHNGKEKRKSLKTRDPYNAKLVAFQLGYKIALMKSEDQKNRFTSLDELGGAEYEGDKNNNNLPDPNEIGTVNLKGDGDFRSEESIELLKKSDIVVTNPPFSLFREFVEQLVKYDKKFLINCQMLCREDNRRKSGK